MFQLVNPVYHLHLAPLGSQVIDPVDNHRMYHLSSLSPRQHCCQPASLWIHQLRSPVQYHLIYLVVSLFQHHLIALLRILPLSHLAHLQRSLHLVHQASPLLRLLQVQPAGLLSVRPGSLLCNPMAGLRQCPVLSQPYNPAGVLQDLLHINLHVSLPVGPPDNPMQSLQLYHQTFLPLDRQHIPPLSPRPCQTVGLRANLLLLHLHHLQQFLQRLLLTSHRRLPALIRLRYQVVTLLLVHLRRQLFNLPVTLLRLSSLRRC